MEKNTLFEETIRTRDWGKLEMNGFGYEVFRAYEYTNELGLGMLTFKEIIWTDKIEQMVENLNKLNVDVIQIADNSTALMSALAGFEKGGFKLVRTSSYLDNWGSEVQTVLMRREI